MLNIISMASCRPTTVIDNQFLADLDTGTSVDWIREKIGIETRVTTLPLDYIKQTRNQDPRVAQEVASMSSTEMGARAALDAIKKAGISASQLGLIICNSCTPRQSFPGEAFRIAQALDIPALSYDVYSACPAFALHMDYLSNFDEQTLPEFVLCVATGAYTNHVNYNDRTDGAIWGDGAAAWIVSTKNRGRLVVKKTSFEADPTRSAAVVVKAFGFFQQDGRAVRDFSVRQTVRLLKSFEQANEVDWSRDIFIGHQANRTMLQQIVDNREIPDKNHWHNVTYLGNQAGAGAPSVLSDNWDNLVSGQRVAVAVVGAGLSWGSVLFEVGG